MYLAGWLGLGDYVLMRDGYRSCSFTSYSSASALMVLGLQKRRPLLLNSVLCILWTDGVMLDKGCYVHTVHRGECI